MSSCKPGKYSANRCAGIMILNFIVPLTMRNKSLLFIKYIVYGILFNSQKSLKQSTILESCLGILQMSWRRVNFYFSTKVIYSLQVHESMSIYTYKYICTDIYIKLPYRVQLSCCLMYFLYILLEMFPINKVNFSIKYIYRLIRCSEKKSEVLAAKSDYLSSILGTNIVEEESQL